MANVNVNVKLDSTSPSNGKTSSKKKGKKSPTPVTAEHSEEFLLYKKYQKKRDEYQAQLQQLQGSDEHAERLCLEDESQKKQARIAELQKTLSESLEELRVL